VKEDGLGYLQWKHEIINWTSEQVSVMKSINKLMIT
jgi:hypothetical protein